MTTSDSPVIYDISPEGITLPDGYSFHAHGHINYKVVTLDGTYLRTENMHFDPNNGHPGGAYIGQTFFPFNLAEGECVSWVQLGHNKIELNNPHFGEGGQEPVCKDETQPEPPVLNDPEFQWVTGEPVIDCEGMTVTVVSHEEAAGWYWGNDGEQYLGGFFPTGNESSDVRPATAEECPAPPPEEETPDPDDITNQEPETATPNTGTQPVQDVSQPEQLAVTGGGLEWAALIIGAVFVAAGLVLYLKRPKR